MLEDITYHELRTAYDQSKERVLDVLSAIAALRGLQLTDGDLVETAIDLARSSGREFADAYIAVAAQKIKAEIATFNLKHFQRLGAKLYDFTS